MRLRTRLALRLGERRQRLPVLVFPQPGVRRIVGGGLEPALGEPRQLPLGLLDVLVDVVRGQAQLIAEELLRRLLVGEVLEQPLFRLGVVRLHA